MTELLVVTTLYPNQIQFRHGIFVEARLRRLLSRGGYRATVIAPVPWFPFESRYFPGYSRYAKVPALEQRHGITIYHPRYLVIPKIGMLLTPMFLAIATLRKARELRRSGHNFDLIDAHYYYPDAVAAALVSRALGKPFVATARGSDINVIPQFRLPRRMIRWAASRAAKSIAVSDALRRRMVELGVDGEAVSVLRNGVDLQQFQPAELSPAIREHAEGANTLLSVGNLVELKGHDLVIRAMPQLPDCELLIVGDGQLRASLERLAADLQVTERVRFLGALQQDKLVEVYSAAHILVLASSREGMPNVVLEAMACDTPVVATAVGGVPEIVCSPEAGVLVHERSVAGIARGIGRLLAAYPEKGATRAYAERFSWDQTIAELHVILQDAVDR